ncbi:MAG TPA: hypothetical protein VLV31_01065 [Candidatus Acidoferrales bacterium]|nr:hypothetical protein [Candidatus Acidoferrales bacterium]
MSEKTFLTCSDEFETLITICCVEQNYGSKNPMIADMPTVIVANARNPYRFSKTFPDKAATKPTAQALRAK